MIYSAYPIHSFKLGSTNPLIPRNLWEISEPPKELYIQGKPAALNLLQRLPETGLALVGTRTPQSRSIIFLQNEVARLNRSGLILISGLARGIDTVAHWSAIKAGLPTIAILGAGLDIPYPRENSELKRAILEADGLLVSEFPLGTPAKNYHFLRRNRIIAGWSQATCVIEAGYRSGALNTARWARDQNRTCFAVPGYPGDPALSGNQTLLNRDHALCLWSAESLGAVWLNLATLSQRNPPLSLGLPDRFSLGSRDAHILEHQVATQTLEHGNIGINDLLDWAVSQNWKPDRFFSALESAIEENFLVNKGGRLEKK